MEGFLRSIWRKKRHFMALDKKAIPQTSDNEALGSIWGGRWDSNPRHLEPQSSALTN
jgi:hypothetical protein